jgi:hypothetical protein
MQVLKMIDLLYRLHMNWIQVLKFVLSFYRGHHFTDLAFISSFSTPSMSRMKQELFPLGTKGSCNYGVDIFQIQQPIFS